MTLNVEPNLADPDEFYEALLDAHRGLTSSQSQDLNARLILLLSNHIGDLPVLRDALRRARLGVDDDVARSEPAATDRTASPHDDKGE